jgi:hypothetical protein
MARVYERYGDRIIAQADGTALTATYDPNSASYTGGAATLVDKASTANADGAQWFDVYIDVSTAPTTATTAEVWITGSSNGTDESIYEFALTVAIPITTTLLHRVGNLYGTPQEFNAKIRAVEFGFIAALYLVPVYPADA